MIIGVSHHPTKLPKPVKNSRPLDAPHGHHVPAEGSLIDPIHYDPFQVGVSPTTLEKDKFYQNLTPDIMYYTRTKYQLKIFCRTPEYAKMFQMKISKIT